MMTEIDNWPGSVVQKIMLLQVIGKFLRTHQGGGYRLLEWLDSVPSDRTEEDYARLRKQWDEDDVARRRVSVERINAYQRSIGGNEIDIHGDIVRGPNAPRNLKQAMQAKTERNEIRRLLRAKPALKPKQILQILGWPLSKLRAVQNHIKAIRAER